MVRELLDSGYDCTVTWVVEAELERAEAEFGDRATFVRADLVDPQGGADDAVAAVDDLEAVVDLVGGFASGPLAHETAREDFDRMLRLNLVARRQPRARSDAAAAGARRRLVRRRLGAPGAAGRSPAPPPTSPPRRPCSRSSRRSTPTTARRASARTRSCRA